MVKVTGLAALAVMLATSYTVDALKADVVRAQQEAFKALPAAMGTLFANPDSFRHHTSDLFNGLTPAHYQAMFGQFDAFSAADRSVAFSHITESDMANIQKDRVHCREFGANVAHLKDKVVGKMNWECLELALPAMPGKQLKQINSTAFKSGMLQIVNRSLAVPATPGVFVNLSKEQIKLIVDSKDEDVWRAINVDQLLVANIDKRAAKFKELRPKAFSGFVGHDTVALSNEVLKLLSDDIYAEYEGVVAPKTMENMTPRQLANYNANVKDLDKCKHLDIASIPAKNLGQLKPECYASFLENLAGKPDPNKELGQKFAKLPDNIFANVKDSFELEAIHPSEWQAMRRPHLEAVVKSHPEACYFIPAEMADSKNLSSLHPDARCFRLLKAPVQAALVAKHLKDLPENVLSGVTSDKLSDWSHTKGNSLSFIEGLRIDPKYLVHLGSAVDTSEHPCILFDNKDDVLGAKHFMKNMGPHCFYALTILSEFEEKDMKEFPERVFALQTPEAILKSAPGLFPKLDSVTMGLMVKGDNFCGKVDSKVLATIPAAAFSAMTYKCMQDMKKNVGALSEAQLSFLTEDTVKSIDAEMAKSLSSVAAFKAPQLKVLNASAFSVATKEVVARLTVEQLAVLSAEQLAAIPAAAFAAFTTKEQVAALRPEALTKVVFEQIKEVKEEALVTLSPAQIRSLGKAVTEAGKKPAKIFTPAFIAKLPKESAEAAKECAVGNSAASLYASASALAVLAAISLLF